MAKNILGLDLGTTSIGWAFVKEAENDLEQSSIEKIGVRVNPLTTDEQTNFEKGKPITTNAGRTLKRGMRRSLSRYKLRRENLINILKEHKLITDDTKLNEDGKGTTFETHQLRAKAVSEKIGKEEFIRVLLAINKKRGYKSSRKAKNEEEEQVIDGMKIAKELYEKEITPGQFIFNLLSHGKRYIPSFYRSDLQMEFDKVWEKQKSFYPEILTDEFYKEIKGQGQRDTASTFWKKYGFNTAQINDIEDSLKTIQNAQLNKRDRKKLQAYKWRNDAISLQLEKEEMAFVLADINNNLKKSSGYLGAIGDRSKKLFFNNLTVGQFQYNLLKENPNNSLKNLVFYRQDYMDEFEKIWECQNKFYPEYTDELKAEIRDVIIFYQRKLKSQKGLISFCELEQKEITTEQDGKVSKRIIGAKVAPRSSVLFQEFKIWQNLHNVVILDKKDKYKIELAQEAKEQLFEELNTKGNLKNKTILELLGFNTKDYELNYSELEGNKTNQALLNAYLKILEAEGLDEDFAKLSNSEQVEVTGLTLKSKEIKSIIKKGFDKLGIDSTVLNFNAELDGVAFEQQSSYALWHLLYSYESDDSPSGNEHLYKLLEKKFGFKEAHAKILANVSLIADYGQLSTKAIRKIYPHIKENGYSYACELTGYKHSKSSLTKEEIENKILKPSLDLLKRNSLRNPVVEKILNQMINVINALIKEENNKLNNQGKTPDFHFDEIRIELAREMKKSAKERAEMVSGINAATRKNEQIKEKLQKEFGIKNPTRNDIVKYRLYEELANNGFKDLYTNQYIPQEKLFTKDIDIEHIIPQSKLFDDSFSNKTIVYRNTNLEKGSQTAFDYIESKFGQEGIGTYKQRVELMFNSKENPISKAKYQKLLKREEEIGDGFIERDLRDSQYIARKAKDILLQITRTVVSTSGTITDRLREDWGLIDILKELNLPKYRKLGMTRMEERKFGQSVEIIEGWTKRNDHRHHAMDALTIAFTKHSHIQYLNYLNARKNEKHKKHSIIIAIEQKETETKPDNNGSKKRVFKSPIPNFRQVAKEHLESVLVSHKAKNKVVTKNKNTIKTKNGIKTQIILTPRGQLHKETVYGKYHFYQTKEERISSNFDKEMISRVCNPTFRRLLLKRLEENNNDPQKTFAGKNALNKVPIYINEEQTEQIPEKIKIAWLEVDYSIRKDINPINFKDEKSFEKVIDKGIKEILKKRWEEYGKDAKKAFSDLEQNPIWLNKEKGIQIKRVTISGISNAEALHYKKNHYGAPILDKNGKKIPVDFVSTGNNHHVAIYRDADGNLQESVVSFFEATERARQGLPIIDKSHNQHLGWQFLFSMKQNEMFVFPNEEAGFDPKEIDLRDGKNYKDISPNIFRVQKLSNKDYFFRNHLETNVDNNNNTKGFLWKRLGINGITEIIKVRINHLGKIVSVGEY